MIQHQQNDPRRPQREAAEKVRQDRRTRMLLGVIAALVGVILIVVARRMTA